MLIPIGFSSDGCPEWAIIEWQGDVEHRPEHMPDDVGNMDIGTLSVTDRGGFQMRIGYHLLDGKQVMLKAPLAVLESQPVADDSESGASKHFQVVGVVRSKLLFKTRPKPVISKPEGKAQLAAITAAM